MEANGENGSGSPLSAEQVPAVLATIPPRALLDGVRAAGAVADRIFAGFRMVPASLKLGPVRQRLEREALADPELQQALRSAWEDANAGFLAAVGAPEGPEAEVALAALVEQQGLAQVRLCYVADGREPPDRLPQPPQPETPPAPQPQPGTARPDLDERALHLEQTVRELREEMQKQRRAHERLEHAAEEARQEAQRWKAACQEKTREVEAAARASQRQTRQMERAARARAEAEAQLHEVNRTLRRTVSEMESHRRQEEERARANAERKAALPPPEAWLQAARDLVRHKQAASAVALLAPLAQAHPDMPPLREVLAEAYQLMGALPAALSEWCWLARWKHERGQMADAFRCACRALSLEPADPEAGRFLREIAARLAAQPDEQAPEVARRLQALARQCPEAHQVVLSALAERGWPARPSGGPTSVDLCSPLVWPDERGEFALSLGAIIEAVDTNQVDVVQRVRRSLAALRAAAPERHRAILQALRRHDDSYRTVLVRRTRPVVVDGSNVAWYGQDAGRPRLAHLDAIRRELRGLGFFPIHLFVDAALLHQIDQRVELGQQVARGEVRTADAGRDGDEQILNEARDLRCAVVTNDRMLEHDVRGEVRKLHFDIGPDGAVIREWRDP